MKFRKKAKMFSNVNEMYHKGKLS